MVLLIFHVNTDTIAQSNRIGFRHKSCPNIPIFPAKKLTPDFLVIGHICHDKIPGGFTPGGAAAYAGLLSHRLGHNTAILTAYGDDFQFASQFEGINVHAVASPQTTVFENIYHDGQRTQYLHSRANPLTPADLPAHWQAPKTVLLGPICDEVSFGFLDFFAQKDTITCACPQGWMRQWDAQHQVFPKPIPDWQLLAKADIISMSEADVGGDWALIEHIASIAPLLLVTQGAQGATVFEQGHSRRQFPALPVEEVEPTGAGDIFAAAFTLCYAEERDVERAARFAIAAAGVSVTGKGMGSVPEFAEVSRFW